MNKIIGIIIVGVLSLGGYFFFFSEEPDERLSSPENTVVTMLTAMKTADVETFLITQEWKDKKVEKDYRENPDVARQSLREQYSDRDLTGLKYKTVYNKDKTAATVTVEHKNPKIGETTFGGKLKLEKIRGNWKVTETIM